MPAAIENEPKVVKNDMNAAPGVVGRPRARPASCCRPRARAARASAAAAATTRVGAAPTPPPVRRRRSRSIEPGLAEQPLRGRERHQQARVGRRAAVVADDRPDARGRGRAAGEDADRVAGARVELVGAPSRSGRPRRAEVGERDGLAAGADVAEAAHAAPGRSRTASRAARSAGSSASWTATGSTITGATPSTRPEPATARAIAVRVAPAGSSARRSRRLPSRRARRSTPFAATTSSVCPSAVDARRSGSSGSSCRRSRARRR